MIYIYIYIYIFQKRKIHKTIRPLEEILADKQHSDCIFWNFSPPKAFYFDPPKLRNFLESSTLPF